MKEATVIINGQPLSAQQVASLRAAIRSFRTGLGKADVRAQLGRTMADAHDERLRPVEYQLLIGGER